MSKDATFYINCESLRLAKSRIHDDWVKAKDEEKSNRLWELYHLKDESPDLTFESIKLITHYCEFSSEVTAFRELLEKYNIEYQEL